MHPNNPYATKKPDFKALASRYTFFEPFVTTTPGPDGFSNIDWKDVSAVRALNRALLKEDWDLEVNMKEDRLCPPVRVMTLGARLEGSDGRLDYLYHLIDLEPYRDRQAGPIQLIDIGTGAMAIYPLLFHRLRPDAIILATEKDTDSLNHARQVASSNQIKSEAISILEVPASGGILFPLLNDPDLKVDFTMCNSPFFSSSEEMQRGIELKIDQPHAAPSAAYHELICDGGEAAFVGQMIIESLNIGTRCTWYTSLIGRYASLATLVTQLKSEKIDNYYIIPSQPAKTVRWILIWSHTSTRLPDTKFRNDEIPANLLPPPNTLYYETRTPHSASKIKEVIITFLDSVQIQYTPHIGSVYDIDIKIKGNTWSRAARRKQSQAVRTEPAVEVMRATLHFADNSLTLNWTHGSSRADIDSLWKSMLAKSGLVDRAGKRAAERTEDEGSSRKELRSGAT